MTSNTQCPPLPSTYSFAPHQSPFLGSQHSSPQFFHSPNPQHHGSTAHTTPEMNSNMLTGAQSWSGSVGSLSGDMQIGLTSPAPQAMTPDVMPRSFSRSKAPKTKFSPEEDLKLIALKEEQDLTWKEIAEHFPSRSSGTLQVRYCTKLKAKTVEWTDETVRKLQTAIDEYEEEKWRIISTKLGNGYSPSICREKAEELEGAGMGDDRTTTLPAHNSQASAQALPTMVIPKPLRPLSQPYFSSSANTYL